MKYDTSLLHGNFKGDAGTGATLVPVYQSSAFGQETAEQIEKIFHNKAAGFAYTRISNPTTASFENRITYLEGGIASVAVSSGMAAISATFLNILSSGDEIISKNSIFGGTLDLFKDFENLGIKIHLIDEITEDEMKKYVNENTKAVFAETIGNPKLDVTDVKNASEIVHSFGLPFILDNTTATFGFYNESLATTEAGDIFDDAIVEIYLQNATPQEAFQELQDYYEKNVW